MVTSTLTQSEANLIKEQWVRDVSELTQQVQAWLEHHPAQPAIGLIDTRVSEFEFPRYGVNMIEVDFRDEGQITLESPRRNYPGRGMVYLVAWPTLRKVRLIQDEQAKSWIVYTDSNIPLHEEWNESNFLRLVDDLRAEV